MNSSISAFDRQDGKWALSSGARRRLVSMGVAALATLACYVGLIFYQLGVEPGAGWWLRDIVLLRNSLYADRIAALPRDQSKVLIVGGSSSLFGIDSTILEKFGGRPAFNFGLHAGLDIDLPLSVARDFVHPGDLVVLPLEFEYYSQDAPNELSAPSLMAYFYQFADRMPVLSLLQILFSAPSKRVLELAIMRMYSQLQGHDDIGRSPDLAALLADWQEKRSIPLPASYGPQDYDYTTINRNGDRELRLETPQQKLDWLFGQSTTEPSEIYGYSLAHIKRWQDIITRRGAKLFLTWPVILEDDHGTIFKDKYWSNYKLLADSLARNGIPIHCDPINSIVPLQYRFDTIYHVNIKGQIIYSHEFGECLKNIADNIFDYNAADPNEMARRAKARVDSFRVPPDPLEFEYEKNLRRLAALKVEIDAARLRDGRYPASAPEPPNDAAAVWYRSDGNDYKLLIEDPQECNIVAMADPNRVDPTRRKEGDCFAYGYWSAGAAAW